MISNFAILIQSLISLLIIMIVVTCAKRYFLGSKSYIYRKKMVDIYVIAKIKKVAKAEGIDIDNELLEYHKYNSEVKELDDKIEEELTNQLEEKPQKKEK